MPPKRKLGELESDRKLEIFKEEYPNEVLGPENSHEVFQMSPSDSLLAKYSNYFGKVAQEEISNSSKILKIKQAEQEIKQVEQEIRKAEQKQTILNLLNIYPIIDCDEIIANLPRAIILKEYNDYNSLQSCLQNAKNLPEEAKMLLLNGLSKELQTSSSNNNMVGNLSLVPNVNFTVSEGGKFINLVKEIHPSEFFPMKSIFIRDCYKTLYDQIIEVGSVKQANAVVIGDPGTGKSTLLRYCFLMLRKSKHKVFWAMESGQWCYCNETGAYNISDGDSMLWKDEDVWLLVDGTAANKFMSKLNRVILFSSPQRSNYQKLIKATGGYTLIHPPWTLDEVKLLFDHKVVAKSIGMLSFDSFVADNYDTDNASNEDIHKRLWNEEVVPRFEVIGGRIRLLLSQTTSRAILLERVRNSIVILDPNHIFNAQCFALEGTVPSILYSMYPKEGSGPYLGDYVIHYASETIRDLAVEAFLHFKREAALVCYNALSQSGVFQSVMGDIFESVTFRLLRQGNIKLLVNCLESDDGSCIYDIPPLTLKTYGKDDNLKDAVKKGNILLVPKSSIEAQVDCVVSFMHKSNDGQEEIVNLLLQMTVSKGHSYVPYHIKKLAERVGWNNASDYKFVFVVPSGITFSKKQQVTAAKAKKSEKNVVQAFGHGVSAAAINPAPSGSARNLGIKQHVLTIDENLFLNLFKE